MSGNDSRFNIEIDRSGGDEVISYSVDGVNSKESKRPIRREYITREEVLPKAFRARVDTERETLGLDKIMSDVPSDLYPSILDAAVGNIFQKMWVTSKLLFQPDLRLKIKQSRKLQERISKVFYSRWNAPAEIEIDNVWNLSKEHRKNFQGSNGIWIVVLFASISEFGFVATRDAVDALIDSEVEFCSYEVFKIAEDWENYKNYPMDWTLETIDLSAIL